MRNTVKTMYKKLAKLLNDHLPNIRIDNYWMDNGYFRPSLVSYDLRKDLEVHKDSYSITFLKFDGTNDLYGKEFCVFKIITYTSTCPDSIAANHNMEIYDPSVNYHFRPADFIQSSKTSLRKNNNLYIRTSQEDDTEDFCIYRDTNWDSYIIPKNMTEEEHFQNTMKYDLPPYSFFENIYELNEVNTYANQNAENIGRVCYIDLYNVENNEDYFSDLESCLKFLVNLTGRLDEFRTY